MKRALLSIISTVFLAAPAALSAQEPGSDAGRIFESFRVISERNIFNPNRSARSSRSPVRTEMDPERAVRREAFALVGTMSYDQKRVAFFDGTSSEYRRAFHRADTIAGHKIAEISQNYVKLDADGQEVKLPVGMEMRKQGDGEWEIGARSQSTESRSWTRTSGEPASASPGVQTNASAGAPSSGEESDILKRLMQQREQEINK